MVTTLASLDIWAVILAWVFWLLLAWWCELGSINESLALSLTNGDEDTISNSELVWLFQWINCFWVEIDLWRGIREGDPRDVLQDVT